MPPAMVLATSPPRAMAPTCGRRVRQQQGHEGECACVRRARVCACVRISVCTFLAMGR